MRLLAIAFGCLMLGGCDGSGLQCDNPAFVSGLQNYLNGNNNTLFYQGYALYQEANRSKAPSAGEIDRQIGELKASLQKAKSVCAREQVSSMVCEDMSMYPTLESFSQINYNGNRPVTSAEIEIYRASFLPLFNQLSQLQRQKAGDWTIIQQRENELRSAFGRNVKYEVGLFRLKLRNEQTGAAICEARVTMNSPNGTWFKDILYSLENTTDGRLHYSLQTQL